MCRELRTYYRSPVAMVAVVNFGIAGLGKQVAQISIPPLADAVEASPCRRRALVRHHHQKAMLLAVFGRNKGSGQDLSSLALAWYPCLATA